MRKETIAGLLALIGILGSVNQFYFGGSDMVRKWRIKELGKGIENDEREIQKIIEQARENLFFSTTIYSQKVILLGLAALQEGRDIASGHGEALRKSVVYLRKLEKEFKYYSAQLDEHRKKREARTRRKEQFNWYNLFAPFEWLVYGLFGLVGLTVYLDLRRPGLHYRYPVEYQSGRGKLFHRFGDTYGLASTAS